jgi:hypothetical protein
VRAILISGIEDQLAKQGFDQVPGLARGHHLVVFAKLHQPERLLLQQITGLRKTAVDVDSGEGLISRVNIELGQIGQLSLGRDSIPQMGKGRDKFFGNALA